MPGIPALKRLREEELEFKTSMGYLGSLSQKQIS
jgi:hypothetical protein